MYKQVPTTLLDCGDHDRAYQGRSFAHQHENVGIL